MTIPTDHGIHYAVEAWLKDQVSALHHIRKTLHKYPEPGWREFRTASTVAQILDECGFNLSLGQDVIEAEARMAVPENQELDLWYQRAESDNLPFLEAFKGGFTGLVGTKVFTKEGPTLALRFDLDALTLGEVVAEDQPAHMEKYKSIHEGVMHGCGHDGHASLGIMVAKLIAAIGDQFPLKGTLKLIFQPAEEGVRGAKSMVANVDDVDMLLGAHFWPVGSYSVIGGLRGLLATSKLDAQFFGTPAHAGKQPELGNNALLAAAQAMVALQGAPRHSQGVTRINVGTLQGGTDRNIIPAFAKMQLETRGSTTEAEAFIRQYAIKALEHSAAMQGCRVEIDQVGSAPSGDSSPGLAQFVETLALKEAGTQRVHGDHQAKVSEDFAYLMKAVQDRGGQASFIGLGMDSRLKLHSHDFDIPQEDFEHGCRVIAHVLVECLHLDYNTN